MPGHNNWIAYVENDQSYFIKFNFSEMKDLNREQAITNNIEKICEDHGENIYIAMSGNCESEFVAECFKNNNKPFKVVMVDYLTNKAELWYAKKWCYENNIIPEIITISASDMESTMLDLYNKHKCTYISTLDFIIKEYVESKGAKFIGGGPEPFSRNTCFNDDLKETISENLQNLNMYTYFKFCSITNNSHPYKFLMYTPEMLYNIVNEMSYNKPIQIAMAEYYRVIARPKTPYSHLWKLFFPKLQHLNIDENYFGINLGNKNQLLDNAKNRKYHNVFSSAPGA